MKGPSEYVLPQSRCVHHRITCENQQDIYVSPGDPLFYLHHAFIDRLWWKWQNLDIEARLYEIGGYTTYPASDGGNTTTTLEFGLQLLGVWEDKVVGDVMDLHNSFLCHEYDY